MFETLDILEYEYEVQPGQYFQFDDSFAEDYLIRNVIIDQDNVFTKLLTIYPFDEGRDFVMYLEQTPQGAKYRTNYPLRLKEGSDRYEAVLPLNNKDL
ncbi:hypothetical protein AWM75_03235 [Aerococcus urinaehominis]|uniref:Uncharacterized protein n=2 Tax=Aerococcus urinaehominis TaxID=128944 RepID=A0A0X8FKP0_9LACT|nr:hypothetical protein [Aerococcus urinaehominis]AMB99074.1 hypothetical protein AWM75_03235 [Aerococcus urinaehominis]SDM02641.1 hypothetical protein SAMN04487985_1044 [Aerococcus urinaehominis]